MVDEGIKLQIINCLTDFGVSHISEKNGNIQANLMSPDIDCLDFEMLEFLPHKIKDIDCDLRTEISHPFKDVNNIYVVNIKSYFQSVRD